MEKKLRKPNFKDIRKPFWLEPNKRKVKSKSVLLDEDVSEEEE